MTQRQLSWTNSHRIRYLMTTSCKIVQNMEKSKYNVKFKCLFMCNLLELVSGFSYNIHFCNVLKWWLTTLLFQLRTWIPSIWNVLHILALVVHGRKWILFTPIKSIHQDAILCLLYKWVFIVRMDHCKNFCRRSAISDSPQ